MNNDAEVLIVNIDEIDASHNIRADIGDLTDLADSIAQVGVLTPITITPMTDDHECYKWILVAGHRRVAACQQIGIWAIPALVLGFDDAADRLVATLVENLVRDDLDPVDEARGYQQLIEAGWNQTFISLKIGRSKAHISKRLRMLELPEEAQERIRSGHITVEHAYNLTRLAKMDGITTKKIINLSTRAAVDTDKAIMDQQAKIAINTRIQELKDEGWKNVTYVKNLYSGKLQQLDYMHNLDSVAHEKEPCHQVAVYQMWGENEKVYVSHCCNDTERHRPGGDSTLKMRVPEQTEEQKAFNAAQAEKREAKRQRKIEIEHEIGEALRQADPEKIEALVWKLSAGALLERGATDQFIKCPDDPQYRSWEYPIPVIAEATPTQIMMQLALQWMYKLMVEQWWVNRNPERAEWAAEFATSIGLDPGATDKACADCGQLGCGEEE